MMAHFVRGMSLTFVLMSVAITQSDELIRLRQDAVRSAADHVAESVVQIETIGGLEKVGRVLIGTGPTSGLIVSEDGYILSSAFNFIQRPNSILVTLANGERIPATVVARDRSRMLVLLKIETDDPLPVPEAIPRDDLRVGQTVVAIGKTFDAKQVNLSVGILSATNRIWGKAVQTDANVSPANYGGPLIDLEGRVIGVLVPLSPQSTQEVAGAEWYDSGIGFAVPLADVQRQMGRLKTGDDLLPGKLGVAFEGADALDPLTKIAVVKLNSPAAQAGLKTGDRIAEVNGQPVERQSQLRHQLGPLYAGDQVTLRVVRADETLELKATLADKIPAYEHAFLGILPKRGDEAKGVDVCYVFPSSPAANVGLQADDQLIQINDEPIEDAQQLRGLLARLQPDQASRLTWKRQDEVQTGNVKLGRLPEAVPDSLPTRPVNPPAGQLQTGTIRIEIPEEPNQCTAYIPETLDQGHIGGLLVLLLDPSDSNGNELIAQWHDVSEAHDLVLLLPEPNDAGRWQRAEIAFIRKTIDHVVDRFALDNQRVVVLGQESGGAMAYLVGFRHRDVVRGIVALDAPVPGRIRGVENEPLQRLAILTSVTPDSPVQERVANGIKAFRQLKFPVTELRRDEANSPITDTERSVIGRWVDSLDRL